MAQMHHKTKRLQEEEESTETMVCTVLSALQNLSKHPDISKKVLSVVQTFHGFFSSIVFVVQSCYWL